METLVLSQSWEPLQRVSWQDAFRLLFSDKAEVVLEYADRVVRSVSRAFPVPSIIRLTKRSRTKRKSLRYSPENVYLRDKGECQFCGVKLPKHNWTRDHVLPRSRGGRTTWDNIVASCHACNQKKGNRTPEEAGMRLRSKPQKPRSLPVRVPCTNTPEEWHPYLKAWGLDLLI